MSCRGKIKSKTKSKMKTYCAGDSITRPAPVLFDRFHDSCPRLIKYYRVFVLDFS